MKLSCFGKTYFRMLRECSWIHLRTNLPSTVNGMVEFVASYFGYSYSHAYATRDAPHASSVSPDTDNVGIEIAAPCHTPISRGFATNSSIYRSDRIGDIGTFSNHPDWTRQTPCECWAKRLMVRYSGSRLWHLKFWDEQLIAKPPRGLVAPELKEIARKYNTIS